MLLTVDDYEKEAAKRLPKPALDYYRSGSDGEHALRRNKNAFQNLLIRPLCLRDVSSISTRCTWLGVEQTWPVGIAPSAFHRMATEGGEIETVRGAKSTGTTMVSSSLATTRLEDTAAEAGEDGKLWYQLYVYKDRSITESVIRRAEKAGYKALVLTVDTNVLGQRLADHRNNFSLPPPLQIENFRDIDTYGNLAPGEGSGLLNYVNDLVDAGLSWQSVQWLKGFTRLPILLKGVMRPEDARRAVEVGVAGIIVSNHGGRQLDSSPATIEALPDIVSAVEGRLPVFVDGGVRTGQDVFKAVALGASGVFVGRPILWGLAVNGAEGVKSVLNIIRKEFEHCMRLSGISSVSEIRSTPDLVVHESYYAQKIQKQKAKL